MGKLLSKHFKILTILQKTQITLCHNNIFIKSQNLLKTVYNKINLKSLFLPINLNL